MPSWNIHTAHVEKLLAEEDPLELGIRSINEFLFGNYVPDIYVGYLVPNVSHTLRYCDTHVTEPHAIPIPGEDEFWDEFIEPFITKGGVDDLTLGVWAHLMADNRYNSFVRAFNQEFSIPAGNETRIRKQSDFDRFGKELAPELRVTVTPELLESARHFGPYPIEEEDVRAAVEAANRLLDPSTSPRITGVDAQVRLSAAPTGRDGYLLLTQRFLEDAFTQTDTALRKGLHRYVRKLILAGGDPAKRAPVRHHLRKKLPVGPPPEVLLANNPQAAAADAPISVNAQGTAFSAGEVSTPAQPSAQSQSAVRAQCEPAKPEESHGPTAQELWEYGRKAREAVAEICHRLAAQGVVGAFEGNVSVHTKGPNGQGDLMWMTPSATAKETLAAEQVIGVDGAGERLCGSGKPTSELELHKVCYRCRADIGAVIHTHAPALTAYAQAGVDFCDPASAEMQALFGEIPCVAYGLQGTPELSAGVPAALADHDVFLLAHHGAVSVGRTLEDAYAKMITAELLAKTSAYRHLIFGNESFALPEREIARLRALRHPA